MKNIISIITVSAFLLTSCGSSKNVENDTKIYSASERATRDKKPDNDSSDMSMESTNSKTNTTGTAAQTNGSTGAMNNVQTNRTVKNSGVDYNQMYMDLEMDDDQIRTFKSGMDDFQKKRVNMPNGEMLGTMESERTRQLELILSEEQLAKYKDWQVDNEN